MGNINLNFQRIGTVLMRYGYAMWPLFIGLFGETVTACQCGRRLTGRMLDVMSYRSK